MKNKGIVDKLFASKRFNIALSLLLALIIWYIVSLYIDPERSKVITGIPVDFSYNAATYESQGLEILAKPQVTVSIEVVGDGILVNNLLREDFTVYPIYTQVRGAGIYQLQLQYRYNGSAIDRLDIKSPSPDGVTVQFDKVADKKMPVTVNPSLINIEAGYYLDAPVSAPAEVTLHGPESALNKVAKVVANVSIAGTRRESTITTEQLELQDKDGNVISLTENHITLDAEQVEVRLNILEERDVPVTVEFTNVPTGFDTDILHMQLSHEKLRIAGPSNLWDTLETFVVAYIDLATIELDSEFSFPIKLPEGFINRDNLLAITATINTEIDKLTMKLYDVDEILVAGSPPKGVKLKTPNNARINNVRIIGSEEDLEKLTSDNLIAQINAPELSLVGGQQDVPVRIIAPGFPNVFATGTYKLICTTTVE